MVPLDGAEDTQRLGELDHAFLRAVDGNSGDARRHNTLECFKFITTRATAAEW